MKSVGLNGVGTDGRAFGLATGRRDHAGVDRAGPEVSS